ncbi:hypothetical protein Ahy_B10g102892 [Arachis hypogaea]|uniref:Retrotransposon gag domain-containing protein n=1 Tax=Arachis hypogaea TaxID=3818 RepID=A0A444X2V9_ARAHY|nr:hypothetical protein Ahy_B10g102892 [Arachis hypogaea]
MDRFFRIYETPEDQMMDLVAVNLEARALAWFQIWKKLNPVTSWLELSTAMQMHFGPSLFETPREELLKLKQIASVKLYFDAFNELAARVYGMDDALMLDCFVGGLHPDLKREVKSRSPASLMQAVSLAKLFEDKFFPPTQNGRSSLRPQLSSHPRTPNHTQQRTESLHLSYNALTGVPNRRSIRFTRVVNGRQIRILMDGSSSDNFLHPALAKQLSLPVYVAPPFKVEVGNGELLQCEGEVRAVPVMVHDHTLFITAFLLPIASEELVLGDIWLETLDTHLVNYQKKFITFLDNNRLITLQGELNNQPTQAQFNHLKRVGINFGKVAATSGDYVSRGGLTSSGWTISLDRSMPWHLMADIAEAI